MEVYSTKYSNLCVFIIIVGYESCNEMIRYLHAIPCSKISMNESPSMKIPNTFSSLQSHFNDFLRGESSWRSFAAQFAPQQEPLHVSVAGMRVKKERGTSVLDRDAQNGKQSDVTETVKCQALA